MERSQGLRDLLEQNQQGLGRAEGQGGVQSDAQLGDLGGSLCYQGRVGFGQKMMRSILDMGA